MTATGQPSEKEVTTPCVTEAMPPCHGAITAITSRVTAPIPPTEEAATTPCVTAAKPLCERDAIALSVIAAARTQGEIAAMRER